MSTEAEAVFRANSDGAHHAVGHDTSGNLWNRITAIHLVRRVRGIPRIANWLPSDTSTDPNLFPEHVLSATMSHCPFRPAEPPDGLPLPVSLFGGDRVGLLIAILNKTHTAGHAAGQKARTGQTSASRP